jgi:hypothetical protein
MLDVAVATFDLMGSFGPAPAYGAGPLGCPMGVHFVSSGKRFRKMKNNIADVI